MQSPPVYPTLYKRSTGKDKIVQWSLQLVRNAKGYDIVTIYGEQGGALIEKRANVSEGKAGRSLLQQVTLEANRRFQNKKEKENYRETMDSPPQAIEMRPMLAQTFTLESTKMTFPLFVQPKLDGIRCISHINPETPIKMISRKGTAINNFDDIKTALAQYNIQEEVFIDGELYCADLTFEKISGLVRSQTLTAIDKATLNKIQYHIYDIYLPNTPLLGYKERHQILVDLFGTSVPPSLQLVHTEYANSVADVKPLHQKYIEGGYEGIMLRDQKGPYQIDKRSKYLQKYKTFIEEEFPIVSFSDEDGMILFQCKTRDNRTFSVRPRGTFESRRAMFAKGDSYIGKDLTVIFQEYTELGVPRFPVGKSVRDYE
jgi:DNA ligase-1